MSCAFVWSPFGFKIGFSSEGVMPYHGCVSKSVFKHYFWHFFGEIFVWLLCRSCLFSAQSQLSKWVCFNSVDVGITHDVLDGSEKPGRSERGRAYVPQSTLPLFVSRLGDVSVLFFAIGRIYLVFCFNSKKSFFVTGRSLMSVYFRLMIFFELKLIPSEILFRRKLKTYLLIFLYCWDFKWCLNQ